jgi:hypothetical protein
VLNFLCIFSLLIWFQDAYAYLDPGTGSLVLQAVLAVFTGGLFVVKTYWQKIKSKLFSRNKAINEDSSDE